jgi:hypothetical protein
MEESSSDEGEDLGGDEEDDAVAVADALEDESSAEEEEEEDDSREPTSSSSSDPTYVPSSMEGSVVRPKVSKQEARLDRMKTAISHLTTLLMAREQPPPVDHSRRHGFGATSPPLHDPGTSDKRVGSTEGKSVLSHLTGIKGCPEIQREDLLKFSKFEEFEKIQRVPGQGRRQTAHVAQPGLWFSKILF